MRRGVSAFSLLIVSVSFIGFVMADGNESILPDFDIQGSPIYKGGEDNLTDGFSLALGKNYRIDFRAEGNKYNMQVNNFSEEYGYAFVTIYSGEYVHKLNLNEYTKIDLDNDDYYEIEIGLTRVWVNRIDVEIFSINEPTIPPVVENTTAPEEVVEDESLLGELNIFDSEDEVVDSNVDEPQLQKAGEEEVSKKSFTPILIGIIVVVTIIASGVVFKDDLLGMIKKK